MSLYSNNCLVLEKNSERVGSGLVFKKTDRAHKRTILLNPSQNPTTNPTTHFTTRQSPQWRVI